MRFGRVFCEFLRTSGFEVKERKALSIGKSWVRRLSPAMPVPPVEQLSLCRRPPNWTNDKFQPLVLFLKMSKRVSRSTVSSSTEGNCCKLSIICRIVDATVFDSKAHRFICNSTSCILLSIEYINILKISFLTPTLKIASAESSLYVFSLFFFFVAVCLILLLQLVIDKTLSSLPRRRTDNAIIIRSQDSNGAKARIFKLNSNTPKDTDAVLIDR